MAFEGQRYGGILREGKIRSQATLCAWRVNPRQQGRSVKDFECHTKGFKVGKLQPEANRPSAGFLNKVVLEYKHTHSVTHC